ncbi:MAG: nitroreductase family protein [Planctomycetota bacterium]|nr:MAG: nitroreductase family protein [Planctomycetota bacterium]
MTHADPPAHVALDFNRRSADEMRRRAREHYEDVARRRSVRHFSDEAVPLEVIEDCIRSAGTAPSGAHRQPWTFALITDPLMKRRIREAAEAEERENYSRRMNAEWIRALGPFGTNAEKPFLEAAPVLIVVLRHAWDEDEGARVQNYYTQESVGIASGFLLAALHHAGLATLTHTPSPMGFLSEVLRRPAYEKPFLLIPVGYPVQGCEVPNLERKRLDEILVRY